MYINDLPEKSKVFIDANIFIYHFAGIIYYEIYHKARGTLNIEAKKIKRLKRPISCDDP